VSRVRFRPPPLPTTRISWTDEPSARGLPASPRRPPRGRLRTARAAAPPRADRAPDGRRRSTTGQLLVTQGEREEHGGPLLFREIVRDATRRSRSERGARARQSARRAPDRAPGRSARAPRRRLRREPAPQPALVARPQRGGRVRSAAERHEERVTLCIDLYAVVGRTGRAHDPTMIVECGALPVAELVEQRRRALDIREEKRYHSTRKLAGHMAMISPGAVQVQCGSRPRFFPRSSPTW
jgi:hypothetical protein